MKKIVTLFILIFFLNSCFGAKDLEKEENITKTDFLIETKEFSELKKEYSLEKSSKIEASSEINLGVETNGRVERIVVKEGEKVIKGQPLVYFSDNTLNLNTNYKQALLGVEQAKIAYESQKITLDKNISDTELNITKLKNNLENTKKSLEQDLIQVTNNLNNTNLNLENSKSNLDIQKIDNQITKQQFDYETQVKADIEKIDSFILNLRREKDNLNNLFTNSIELGDSLFHVKNPGYQNPNYIYIGAGDNLKKAETEDLLKQMIEFQEKTLSNLNLEKEDGINDYFKIVDEGYNLSKKFLNAALDTLNASLAGATGFTELEKNNYISRINALINTNSSLNAAYIGQKTQVNGFLSTYKETQKSFLKQIDLIKKDREIAIKTINNTEISSQSNYDKFLVTQNDTISNLELQLKGLQDTLENAKKTRDVTLRNLENSIKTANISLERAGNELSKLTIKSPISGQIAEVNIEIGQTYSPGKDALKMISTSKRELDVFVNSSDLNKIKVGDKVSIDYKGEKYDGEVFSKSNIANETLNYKVNVTINRDINLVGGVANVSFKLNSQYPLIPINSIIVSEGSSKKIGTINILKDGKIEKVEVELGENYGTEIELITELDGNEKIILNDVTNFEESKFELRIK